jgi:hypothetical protein
MNYPAFTNDSLTMMYEGIRGALAADDALKRQGMGARFRVRETPEWKLHAAELETEMLGRGITATVDDGGVLRMFLIGYKHKRLRFVVCAFAGFRTDVTANVLSSISSDYVDVHETR